MPLSATFGNVTLELRQANIALMNVDAIVNAANEYLSFGAGVAGAIIQQSGDTVQKECHEIGFCPVGSSVITSAGNLLAKYVIHSIGPMYGEGNENAKLSSAVSSAITLAEQKALRSIALPALSTGYFHFPVEECARIMVETIKTAAPTLMHVNHIVICLSDTKKLETFKKALFEG
jgi:O-acetyl-ADP-ribose deacetylase